MNTEFEILFVEFMKKYTAAVKLNKELLHKKKVASRKYKEKTGKNIPMTGGNLDTELLYSADTQVLLSGMISKYYNLKNENQRLAKEIDAINKGVINKRGEGVVTQPGVVGKINTWFNKYKSGIVTGVAIIAPILVLMILAALYFKNMRRINGTIQDMINSEESLFGDLYEKAKEYVEKVTYKINKKIDKISENLSKFKGDSSAYIGDIKNKVIEGVGSTFDEIPSINFDVPGIRYEISQRIDSIFSDIRLTSDNWKAEIQNRLEEVKEAIGVLIERLNINPSLISEYEGAIELENWESDDESSDDESSDDDNFFQQTQPHQSYSTKYPPPYQKPPPPYQKEPTQPYQINQGEHTILGGYKRKQSGGNDLIDQLLQANDILGLIAGFGLISAEALGADIPSAEISSGINTTSKLLEDIFKDKNSTEIVEHLKDSDAMKQIAQKFPSQYKKIDPFINQVVKLIKALQKLAGSKDPLPGERLALLGMIVPTFLRPIDVIPYEFDFTVSNSIADTTEKLKKLIECSAPLLIVYEELLNSDRIHNILNHGYKFETIGYIVTGDVRGVAIDIPFHLFLKDGEPLKKLDKDHKIISSADDFKDGPTHIYVEQSLLPSLHGAIVGTKFGDKGKEYGYYNMYKYVDGKMYRGYKLGHEPCNVLSKGDSSVAVDIESQSI
jgi:hypothetical protein